MSGLCAQPCVCFVHNGVGALCATVSVLCWVSQLQHNQDNGSANMTRPHAHNGTTHAHNATPASRVQR